MSEFITSDITASNGIIIAPSVLKFANGAVLSIGNSSIAYGNDSPIVNADASFTFGTSVVNSSLITLPGLIVGGGSLFVGSIGGIVNTQIFTANGTWTNPNNTLSLSGNEQVFVMMWAGGGGGANSTSSPGGGGGACMLGTYLVSEVGNTATITVGPGGTTGTTGGNSIFTPSGTAKTLTAYGGGNANSLNLVGGGGGGSLGVGNDVGTGGELLGGANGAPGGTSTFGGGGGGNTNPAGGGSSVFGGGGGGRALTLLATGGSNIYGGGGGSGNNGGFGTSVFGGQGGNSSVSATTPGGGGAGFGGSGTRGEIRVWVVR